MGYENLTKGRVSESGRAYSLTMVTEGRIPHFNDFELARSLINKMRVLHDSGQLESLAWVLMPAHLHWIIVIKETDLSEVMRNFKGAQSNAIKYKKMLTIVRSNPVNHKRLVINVLYMSNVLDLISSERFFTAFFSKAKPIL